MYVCVCYQWIICKKGLIHTYVTGFVKRGLIQASDFTTLISHNFICDFAITINFSPTIV